MEQDLQEELKQPLGNFITYAENTQYTHAQKVNFALTTLNEFNDLEIVYPVIDSPLNST